MKQLFIEQRIKAKVTDFGLAKAKDSSQGSSSAGGTIGTLAYMAPEVLGNDDDLSDDDLSDNDDDDGGSGSGGGGAVAKKEYVSFSSSFFLKNTS
jgi:serine/threonine protein kinase